MNLMAVCGGDWCEAAFGVRRRLVCGGDWCKAVIWCEAAFGVRR